MSYTLSREQAENVQKTIDTNAASVMKKVGGYSSTVSKLKVIHDWVVLNNYFSLEGTFDTCGIYNGMTGSGAIQCQGYAKTTQYLCDLAGIDCMTIVGKNEEGSTHAWNIVYCDNGYYILDTTWDDPYGSHNTSKFVRYLYFLANDDIIENSHLSQNVADRSNGSRVKLFDPPSCTKSACYYFKAYNKEYSDLDSAAEGMYAELDAAISSGHQAAHIRVTSHDLWETLVSNDYMRKFQNYAKSKDSSITGLNRQKNLAENALVVEFDIKYD